MQVPGAQGLWAQDAAEVPRRQIHQRSIRKRQRNGSPRAMAAWSCSARPGPPAVFRARRCRMPRGDPGPASSSSRTSAIASAPAAPRRPSRATWRAPLRTSQRATSLPKPPKPPVTRYVPSPFTGSISSRRAVTALSGSCRMIAASVRRTELARRHRRLRCPGIGSAASCAATSARCRSSVPRTCEALTALAMLMMAPMGWPSGSRGVAGSAAVSSRKPPSASRLKSRVSAHEPAGRPGQSPRHRRSGGEPPRSFRRCGNHRVRAETGCLAGNPGGVYRDDRGAARCSRQDNCEPSMICVDENRRVRPDASGFHRQRARARWSSVAAAVAAVIPAGQSHPDRRFAMQDRVAGQRTRDIARHEGSRSEAVVSTRTPRLRPTATWSQSVHPFGATGSRTGRRRRRMDADQDLTPAGNRWDNLIEHRRVATLGSDASRTPRPHPSRVRQSTVRIAGAAPERLTNRPSSRNATSSSTWSAVSSAAIMAASPSWLPCRGRCWSNGDRQAR